MQTNIGLNRVIDNIDFKVELDNNDILTRLRKLEGMNYNLVKELDRLSFVLVEIKRIIGLDVKE